jgi:hypothetical protein
MGVIKYQDGLVSGAVYTDLDPNVIELQTKVHNGVLCAFTRAFATDIRDVRILQSTAPGRVSERTQNGSRSRAHVSHYVSRQRSRWPWCADKRRHRVDHDGHVGVS